MRSSADYFHWELGNLARFKIIVKVRRSMGIVVSLSEWEVDCSLITKQIAEKRSAPWNWW